MSTQDGFDVNFAIVPEELHQHFRLLELPPELLVLLTAENPPILQLKALEGPSGQPLDSNAVLCTPDKTYNLRQVSTSNSLFITQIREDVNDSEPVPTRLQLEAIAKSTSTLETVVSRDSSAAGAHIEAALPVYTSTGYAGAMRTGTKRQLFDNIPLSDAECEQAWTDLACFEVADSARCFVPSPAVRWSVWRSMKTAADAEGLDLTQRLSGTQRDLLVREAWDALLELALAVLRSVSGEWDEDGFQLDETKCTRFVGIELLRERTADGAPTATRAFVESWKERLPRQWEELAKVELISAHSRALDGGRSIVYSKSGAEGVNGAASADAKPSVGAKRKWHEKFRAVKKV